VGTVRITEINIEEPIRTHRGTCRYYPPRVEAPRFPEVDETMWCGYWVAKFANDELKSCQYCKFFNLGK